MKNKLIIASVISFILCSCVSEQEQHEMNMKKCKSYGYKVETKSFADCMKDVDFHNDDIDQREEDRFQEDSHHWEKMDIYKKNKKIKYFEW